MTAGVEALEVDPNKVEWRVSEWTSCSTPCGNGKKSRQAFCTVAASNRLVGEKACEDHEQPILSRSCNAHSCDLDRFEFNAVVTHVEKCSGKCGSEFAAHSVHCLASTAGYVAANDLCDGGSHNVSLWVTGSLGVQSRYSECEPCEGYRWSTTPWSTCSKPCDGGRMHRNV